MEGSRVKLAQFTSNSQCSKRATCLGAKRHKAGRGTDQFHVVRPALTSV